MRMLVGTVFALAVIAVPVANAENWSDARLDQAATQVAGHPITVYCEMSWAVWVYNVPNEAFGFTVPGYPVVYVSPRACETLHALLTVGPEDVGVYYASSAMLTLVHESVHQRGITDEGVTDCTALQLLGGIAVQYFGYHETDTVQYQVRVRKRVVVRSRVVPNPLYSRMLTFAEGWHKAKPPEYQGTC